MKKGVLAILLVSALLLASAPMALAADPSNLLLVEQVDDPATIPCDNLADLEDDPPGNYDGILVSGGLQFAERFAGQTLSTTDSFDVLSESATSPLTLQTGDAGENGSGYRPACRGGDRSGAG